MSYIKNADKSSELVQRRRILIPNQGRQDVFTNLTKIIKDKDIKIVEVEACHFYASQATDLGELKESAKVANEILTHLEQKNLSVKVERSLFIDDLSNKQHIEDLLQEKIPYAFPMANIVNIVKQAGYQPNHIILESSKIPKAQKLLEELRTKGLTKLDQQGKVRLKSQWIALTGKAGHPSCPSCPLLDAAFYLDKLAKADIAITILPKNYKSQQAQTKEILRAVGLEKSLIVVVYFDPKNSEIQTLDYWGDIGT